MVLVRQSLCSKTSGKHIIKIKLYIEFKDLFIFRCISLFCFAKISTWNGDRKFNVQHLTWNRRDCY